MIWSVEVQCSGDARVAWTCFATVLDEGRRVSEHEVRVTPEDLARLAPAAVDPTDLVERSFAFLLEREPPSSILRAFDLSVIDRFFPDYESTIRKPTRAD